MCCWQSSVVEAKCGRQPNALDCWAPARAGTTVGVRVEDAVIPHLRRFALLQSRYFLFYQVDEAANEVMILRVWHMSRGRPPKLKR
jgi:plasmid stabilization system protein ParE